MGVEQTLCFMASTAQRKLDLNIKKACRTSVDESTVSWHLKAMEKIQRKERWLSQDKRDYEPTCHHCLSLLTKHKKEMNFLWRIVTRDEKYIYFNNPRHKMSWVDPGQPSTSITKRNIHGHKILLCIQQGQERMCFTMSHYHRGKQSREIATVINYDKL